MNIIIITTISGPYPVFSLCYRLFLCELFLFCVVDKGVLQYVSNILLSDTCVADKGATVKTDSFLLSVEIFFLFLYPGTELHFTFTLLCYTPAKVRIKDSTPE